MGRPSDYAQVSRFYCKVRVNCAYASMRPLSTFFLSWAAGRECSSYVQWHLNGMTWDDRKWTWNLDEIRYKYRNIYEQLQVQGRGKRANCVYALMWEGRAMQVRPRFSWLLVERAGELRIPFCLTIGGKTELYVKSWVDTAKIKGLYGSYKHLRVCSRRGLYNVYFCRDSRQRRKLFSTWRLFPLTQMPQPGLITDFFVLNLSNPCIGRYGSHNRLKFE